MSATTAALSLAQVASFMVLIPTMIHWLSLTSFQGREHHWFLGNEHREGVAWHMIAPIAWLELMSASNRIFTIDPVTGTAYDFVQTTVPFQSVGLEFVPSEQLLYAATGSQLYTIDPVSGSSKCVGPRGLGHVDDLALHPSCLNLLNSGPDFVSN